MTRTEKSLTQKVLHISNKTFPSPLLFRAFEYGGPKIQSLKILSHSARFRAATSTLTSVEKCAAEFEKTSS